MAHINLLPWRDELREERKNEFFAFLVGSGVVSLFIMIMVHVVMASRIDTQAERNHVLKVEIKLLDKKIAEIKQLKKLKAALIARMAIIQELQTNRAQVVHLFDDVVKVLPKGIHLYEVSRHGNQLTFSGFSDSNTNISKLMRNIDKSTWLSGPVLNEIKTEDKNGKRESEFTLNSSVLSLSHGVRKF